MFNSLYPHIGCLFYVEFDETDDGRFAILYCATCDEDVIRVQENEYEKA